MRYEQGQRALVIIFGKTPADSGIFSTTINQIYTHQDENPSAAQMVEVDTPLGRVNAHQVFISLPVEKASEDDPGGDVSISYLVAGPNAPGAPMTAPQDAAPVVPETVAPTPAHPGEADRVALIYNGPPQQHAIDMLVRAFGPAAAGMGHVAGPPEMTAAGVPKTLYVFASTLDDRELIDRLMAAGVFEFFDGVDVPTSEDWEAAKKTTGSGELPLI